MKRLSPVVLAALAAILLNANYSTAAPQADAKPSDKIVLVNVKQVFENYGPHKERLTELKLSVQVAEEELKKAGAKINEMKGQLKILVPGTPEYAKLQERIIQETGSAQAKLQMQRAEFMKKEAFLYRDSFKEICAAVESYSRKNDISVALQLTAGSTDSDDPKAILASINRAVIWHDSGIDVTSEILSMLKDGKKADKPAPKEPKVTKPKDDKKPPKKPRKPKDKKAEKGDSEGTLPGDATPAAGKAASITQMLGIKDRLTEIPTGGFGLLISSSEKSTKPAADKDDAEEDEADEEETEVEASKVVVMRIAGSLPEGPAAMGMFGELESSLHRVVHRLDAAAGDDDIAAVWIKVGGLGVGRGKLNELREAIARVRKADKPVYAEITGASSAEYLIGSACDKIVMPPSGMLIVPGVRAEMSFYKGLFDKLGIKFDMLQMGKFKGAAEPYTRSEMSPSLRESMEALVDDAYEGMVDTIADSRTIHPKKVKELIDRGVFSAAAAKAVGLIDVVAYSDEIEDLLEKELKVEELELITDYEQKEIDTDFSGLSGLMKFVELMSGGKKSKAAAGKDKIAVIYAVGPIMEGRSSSDLFGNQSLGSTSLIASIRKAKQDPNVKAVVLRINSPGGSAIASDLIWRETQRLEKPLIASMGDVAGSGGYYIAMGAEKIIAEPDTITGSIGVVGGKMVAGGLYEKVGITTDVISRGKVSGAFSSLEPFSNDERKAMTAMLKTTYRQFVSKAAAGRKMEYDELEKLAQGRVYTGRMAVENGLVDELGTLKDAIAAAKKSAGIDPREKVEIMVLPKQKTIFEQMFSDPNVSATLKEAGALMNVAHQVQVIRQLFSEPTLVWMHYNVELK